MFSLLPTRSHQAAHTPTTYRQDQDGRRMSQPAADVLAYDDHYELRLALPGASMEDISITAERGRLSIDAKDSLSKPDSADLLHREFGSHHWRRSFQLGDELNSEDIKASLNNGILNIRISKRAEAAPRRIPISQE